MQAVVLSAGTGTRLAPMTGKIPKALLPIANQPLIEYGLYSLESAGITEVLVVTGHLGWRVARHLRDNRRFHRLRIECVKADNFKKGPIHSLLAAERFVRDDFLLLPCDLILGNKTASEFIALKAEKGTIYVLVSPILHGTDRITKVFVKTKTGDTYGQVVGFEEPATSDLELNNGISTTVAASVGMVICPREIFEYAHAVEKKGLARVVDALNVFIAEAGRCQCKKTRVAEVWFDVDDVGAMVDANSFALDNSMVKEALWGRLYPNRVEAKWGSRSSESNGTLAPRIVGPAIVGDKCTIGQGSVMGPHVSVQNNCIIGKHAVCRNSIIFSHSEIRDNSFIENAVVYDGQIIGIDGNVRGMTAP